MPAPTDLWQGSDLSFVSYAFAVLFLAALLARVCLGPTAREGPYLWSLLILSLVFYGYHVPQYLLLILASTAVDYAVTRAMDVVEMGDPRRRYLLGLSLVFNLGVLAAFKYTAFFIEGINDGLALFGASTLVQDVPDILLPIGISFYTFQSMSYTIDVYRGHIQPQRSFWRVLLFVSFFPQLVAGPIVRGSEFLPQVDRPRRLRAVVILEGGYLIVRGFFLKLVVADNLGPIVDHYFVVAAQPGASAMVAMLTVVCFSGQIFADFAGYSSIARGLAYLLGFSFPVNFRAPYIAGSFSEFWTRWHITLSRWLRDYLYISLGGNRAGAARMYINLMLVMLLGGLWHGAAWTFVVWGGIHGVALALERACGLNDTTKIRSLARAGWWVVVQGTVLLAWVFFRAESIGQGVAVIRNFASANWSLDAAFPLVWGLMFLIPIVLLHLRVFLEDRWGRPPPSAADKAVLSGVLLYLTLAAYGNGDAFIYFQF